MILTTLLGSQPVERVVSLSSSSHVTGQREDGRRSLDQSAVLVNVTDGNLDRGVVLGLDDSASGSALSWHVEVDEVTLRGEAKGDKAHMSAPHIPTQWPSNDSNEARLPAVRLCASSSVLKVAS